MNRKNRGMVLVEMIVLVAVFAILMVPISKLTASLVKNIPDSYSVYQKNQSLLNAITTIKRDVQDCNGIKIIENGFTVNHDKGKIQYKFNDNFLIRNEKDNEVAWELRGCVLKFEIYKNESIEALQINSYISVLSRGRELKKLANNYLFFRNIKL